MTVFLDELHKGIEQMVCGSRIVLGLDDEPSYPCDYAGKHPAAEAREKSGYFEFRKSFINATGEDAKQEIETFLRDLVAHPRHPDYLYREYQGIGIRFQISNLIQFNEKRINFYANKLFVGAYEDLKGICIRCWGATDWLYPKAAV